MKLCPLVTASSIGVPVAGMGGILDVVIGGDIDQLKNEGSPSNDSTAAGEKVATNNVFEDGRLSSGLRSNDDLLWRAGGRQQSVTGKEGDRGAIGTGRGGGWVLRTIWGRSRESFPMVLKTKSCNLLTTPSRSSPRAAMTTVERGKGPD